MSEEVKQTEEVTEQAEAQAPEAKGLSTVFGFKKGMTAVFNEVGKRVPVTVVECEPWIVTQIKTQENEGYAAVQIGFGVTKQKNATKASKGHMKAAGVDGFNFIREVRGEAPEGCAVGTQVGSVQLKEGVKVQVTSKSKGRGFAGAMKRHGFGGGPASHGSGFHRRPGSIGNCTFPGRVMPGRKMPGHYGNKNITVKGVEVVGVHQGENIILLKGAVPGPVNGLVKIAVKG